MKTLVTVLVGLTIVVFAGCGSGEDVAIFQAPQPLGAQPLSALPVRFYGTYVHQDDASRLQITENKVIRLYDFEWRTHKDSLPVDYVLKGDSLFAEDGSARKARVVGDTLTAHMQFADTVFFMGPDQILTRFKGYVLLNRKLGDYGWEVRTLALKNGTLTLAGVSRTDAIQKLEAITESANDTTTVTYAPTRRQFRKFMRNDGFSVREQFRKIRTPFPAHD